MANPGRPETSVGGDLASVSVGALLEKLRSGLNHVALTGRPLSSKDITLFLDQVVAPELLAHEKSLVKQMTSLFKGELQRQLASSRQKTQQLERQLASVQSEATFLKDSSKRRTLAHDHARKQHFTELLMLRNMVRSSGVASPRTSGFAAQTEGDEEKVQALRLIEGSVEEAARQVLETAAEEHKESQLRQNSHRVALQGNRAGKFSSPGKRSSKQRTKTLADSQAEGRQIEVLTARVKNLTQELESRKKFLRRVQQERDELKAKLEEHAAAATMLEAKASNSHGASGTSDLEVARTEWWEQGARGGRRQREAVRAAVHKGSVAWEKPTDAVVSMLMDDELYLNVQTRIFKGAQSGDLRFTRMLQQLMSLCESARTSVPSLDLPSASTGGGSVNSTGSTQNGGTADRVALGENEIAADESERADRLQAQLAELQDQSSASATQAEALQQQLLLSLNDPHHRVRPTISISQFIGVSSIILGLLHPLVGNKNLLSTSNILHRLEHGGLRSVLRCKLTRRRWLLLLQQGRRCRLHQMAQTQIVSS